jgi:hypothetical protein
MIAKNNDVFFDINSSVKELETMYKINQASLRQAEEENDSLKAINYSLRTSNENERIRRKQADNICEWNLVFMIIGWIVAFVAIANCMLDLGG